MHNSAEGQAAVPGRSFAQGSGPYLLKGGDASSACLFCHQATGVAGPRAYLVSTSESDMGPGRPPLQLTPGGDFGWLKKTWRWSATPGGAAQESIAERHGHNVVAADFGYGSDDLLRAAPGGAYPSDRLACHSCHDPHGRYRRMADGTVATTGLPVLASGSYADSPDPVPGTFAVGSYRLLAGAGYQPKSLGGDLSFVNAPPAAVAPPAYNRSEAATQTRVAYGQGMSEWCANCHRSLLTLQGYTSGMKGLEHPTGASAILTPAIAANYNSYVRTGVLTNTDRSRSYLSLVPFEEGHSTYATLKAHASSVDAHLAGPGSGATVSCLSCHRAHASGFDGILRYRAGGPPITVAGALGGAEWPNPALNPAEAQGRTALETQQAYYDRPATVFGSFQATLCNKCHAKD
jgi:hypothetical protein